jgi:hypothetical protein
MSQSNTPPEVAAYFRAFTERRRRSDRPCAVCGQMMENALLKRRYCSPACRERAHYERHSADVLARQRAYRQQRRQQPAPPPAAPAPARARPAARPPAPAPARSGSPPALPPLGVGARVQLLEPFQGIPDGARGHVVARGPHDRLRVAFALVDRPRGQLVSRDVPPGLLALAP